MVQLSQNSPELEVGRKERNYIWVQSSYKALGMSPRQLLCPNLALLYLGKVLNLHSLLIGALAPGLHYSMYSHWNRILY